jgi:hypothetical protein
MESAMMKSMSESQEPSRSLLPEGASILSRKVARSGHISYEGRPYFISKALAGRYIRLVVIADRLIQPHGRICGKHSPGGGSLIGWAKYLCA